MEGERRRCGRWIPWSGFLPAAAQAHARAVPGQRRRSLLFAGLAASAGVYLWIALASAWREAALREAYLPELEAWARQSPDDGRLLALLGGRLMEAHEHPGAVPVLEHALLSGEQKEPVWLGLAGAAAASGDRARALALLRAGVKTSSPAPELVAALARIEKLPTRAEAGAFAQAVCPEGPEPLVDAYTQGSFLSGLWEWWGRRRPDDSGFATRQRLAGERPEDAEAQRRWGMSLMRNRREIEAGPVLRRAVELAPRSPEAHLALADYHASQGKVPAAAFEYIACLKLRRDWFPALMGLCRVSLRDDLRYGTACFRRATEVQPRSPDAWIAKGLAHYQQGDHKIEEAIEAFRAASPLDPKRTDYFPQWAYVLAQAGRYDEAEALLRRRLSTAPEDVEARFLLAGVLMDWRPTRAKEAEAEKEAREAMRIAPHSGAPRVRVAQLMLKRGKTDEAITLLKSALKSEPSDLQALNVLSRAYARAGRPALAGETSKRARRVFDDKQRIMLLEGRRREQYLDASLHEELAKLYDRNGQRSKARLEVQTARAIRRDRKRVAESTRTFAADMRAVGLEP